MAPEHIISTFIRASLAYHENTEETLGKACPGRIRCRRETKTRESISRVSAADFIVSGQTPATSAALLAVSHTPSLPSISSLHIYFFIVFGSIGYGRVWQAVI